MSDLPLSDVLSITTGCLVSRDHIAGIYRVCDFMTGVANMTHQLPRASEEIRPAILAQHPEFADVKVPDWPRPVTAERVFAWVAAMERRYGETVDLMPLAGYTGQDPIEELCDMVGTEKVFVWPTEGSVS